MYILTYIQKELCAVVIVAATTRRPKKVGGGAAWRKSSLISHACLINFSAKNFCYKDMLYIYAVVWLQILKKIL